MNNIGIPEAQIINLFQSTLQDSVTNCYMIISLKVKGKWEKLIEAFLDNFVFNLKVETTLQDLKQSRQC